MDVGLHVPLTISGWASLWTAGFICVLGLLHPLAPEVAWRRRVRRDLSDSVRPAVRLLGVGLLAFAALLSVVALTVL